MTRDEIVEVMARALAKRNWRNPDAASTWFGGNKIWTEYESCATAALSALEAVGMRVVPEVPNKAMLMAAGRYANYCAAHNYGGCPDTEGTWDAMLAASQEDVS